MGINSEFQHFEGMFLQQTKQAAANLETTKIKDIIVLGMEETPEDCKSFMSLVIGDDGSLYKSESDKFDPHQDIVAMPYRYRPIIIQYS